MQEHYTSWSYATHHPVADDPCRRVFPVSRIQCPQGLSQTEVDTYPTDPGVCSSVRRTKEVWLGNARGSDGPVCGAKFPLYFGIAEVGQVGMGIGVVLYRVPFAVGSPHQIRIPSRLLSDDEEGSLHPIGTQDVQNPCRVPVDWPVVEGESDDGGRSLCLSSSRPSPCKSTTVIEASRSAKPTVVTNARGAEGDLVRLFALP